jgi:hypothetical protein
MGAAAVKAAQVGGGDPSVVAHPAFRRVPKPIYPLKTPEGSGEYRTLASLFFHKGLLTLDRHRELSEYAAQVDALHDTIAKGGTVRASRFDQIKRARKALALHELDRPIAAPEDAPVSKFSGSGFSARR